MDQTQTAPAPAPKRTAVQRIDDLERGLMDMFQAGDNLSRDVYTIKEAIKLLGNKVDAIVKATMAGEDLNDDVLSRIMVENNVADLKSKVDQLVAIGTLVASEAPIEENNFVVGREVDDTGKVLNPRLQFVLASLEEKLRAKIKGAKVGDSVDFKDGKLKFEIQQVYSVVAPKPPEAPAAPDANAAAPTETAAPATPAAEQSSSDASTATAPTTAAPAATTTPAAGN
jgi:hypothetical protein